MNIDILNKIIDIYDALYNTTIVNTDTLIIETYENTEQFNSLLEMIDYMLTDILLGIENII